MRTRGREEVPAAVAADEGTDMADRGCRADPVWVSAAAGRECKVDRECKAVRA